MAIRERGKSGACETRTRRRLRCREASPFRLRPEVLVLEQRLTLSAAGDLDSSFGDGGVAQFTFVPPYEMTSRSQSAFAVAIGSDGKIVTAGFLDPVPGSSQISSDIVAG